MEIASARKSKPLARPNRRHLWLLAIAIFKLVKGLLLLAIGIGALSMLHKDVAEQCSQWINLFRGDPDNKYFHSLLAKLAFVNDRKLEEISAGTFFYASLLLTEGVGLLLRKRWAEYFTVITTTSLIPLEVYEIAKKFSAAKVFVIALNIAIVFYLIARLRSKEKD